jgi:hypothetical protein
MISGYMKIQEVDHVAQGDSIPQITERAAEYQA